MSSIRNPEEELRGSGFLTISELRRQRLIYDTWKYDRAKPFKKPRLNEVEAYFIGRGSTKYQAGKFYKYQNCINWTSAGQELIAWKHSAASWINRHTKS